MIDVTEIAHYVSYLLDLSNKYLSAAIPFLLKDSTQTRHMSSNRHQLCLQASIVQHQRAQR